jgi:hypothetical protein
MIMAEIPEKIYACLGTFLQKIHDENASESRPIDSNIL